MHAMRHDLGVGLGAELIARKLELIAQFLVILDDAVVHDREAAARDMRMRIAFARHTVRRPARMRNAAASLNRQLRQRLLERAHLADGAQALQMALGIEHRDAGGVVTAVLEALEALHEHRHDIAISDASDYAAHSRWAPVMVCADS